MRYLLSAITLLLMVAPVVADDLRIDAARSKAEFSVRLLWVTSVTGRFEGIRGNLTTDPATATAVVRADIDTASIEMESARLRRWVLAPEFFDGEHHPNIHFVSKATSLSLLSHGGGEVEGELTIRGITRPVTFRLVSTRCPPESMAGCILQLQGIIDRTDFGMLGRRGALSDRVTLGMAIVIDKPQ